jgi:predicted kinase
MPGAGKTSLAFPLAAELGYSLVTKDLIKETLYDALYVPGEGDIDREWWSGRLSGAPWELLFAVAAHAGDMVIEANFHPHSDLERDKLLSLRGPVVEVHCVCPAEVATTRYNARPNHPVHLQTLPLSAMDKYDRPVGVGSLVTVDTTTPVDVKAIAAQVRELQNCSRAQRSRAAGLDQMVADSEDAGLYDLPSDVPIERLPTDRGGEYGGGTAASLFEWQPKGADHRRVAGIGAFGAPLLDAGLELGERRGIQQGVGVGVERGYVKKANPVREAEGRVAQSFGLLRRKLGEHVADQSLVLGGMLGLGLVLDHPGDGHCPVLHSVGLSAAALRREWSPASGCCGDRA